MMLGNGAGILAAPLHRYNKYLHPVQIFQVTGLDNVAKKHEEWYEGRKKDRPVGRRLADTADGLMELGRDTASKYQLIYVDVCGEPTIPSSVMNSRCVSRAALADETQSLLKVVTLSCRTGTARCTRVSIARRVMSSDTEINRSCSLP